jgi:hypothetical protein
MYRNSYSTIDIIVILAFLFGVYLQIFSLRIKEISPVQVYKMQVHVFIREGVTECGSPRVRIPLAMVIMVVCCSSAWDEIMSLNRGLQRAYCLSPRRYMSMESHSGIILTGKNRRSRRKSCPSATRIRGLIQVRMCIQILCLSV